MKQKLKVRSLFIPTWASVNHCWSSKKVQGWKWLWKCMIREGSDWENWGLSSDHFYLRFTTHPWEKLGVQSFRIRISLFIIHVCVFCFSFFFFITSLVHLNMLATWNQHINNIVWIIRVFITEFAFFPHSGANLKKIIYSKFNLWMLRLDTLVTFMQLFSSPLKCYLHCKYFY